MAIHSAGSFSLWRKLGSPLMLAKTSLKQPLCFQEEWEGV